MSDKPTPKPITPGKRTTMIAMGVIGLAGCAYAVVWALFQFFK